MNQYVIDRCSDAIKTEMAARYSLRFDELTDLGGFESFVYEGVLNGEPVIIKLGHEHRRSLDMLHAEAEFTRFLQTHGVNVCAAIASPNGNLVEPIDDGVDSRFMAVAWTKASGVRPDDHTDDPAFWHGHGALVGTIHAQSHRFTPSTPERTRPHWDDPLLLDDSLHIPESDDTAIRETARLLTELRSFDRGPAGYGLVHYDAHLWNVHVDHGEITLFDFDDCGYTWFVNDLAVVMYHSLMSHDDPAADAARIWPPFIAGYRTAHQLDPHWFTLFPTFLAWRDHLIYSVLCRSRDAIDDVDIDSWIERFTARHAIGAPLIDYDFTTGTR